MALELGAGFGSRKRWSPRRAAGGPLTPWGPLPTEEAALLAPGLQVHHALPEQHDQQILQGGPSGRQLPGSCMLVIASGPARPAAFQLGTPAAPHVSHLKDSLLPRIQR